MKSKTAPEQLLLWLWLGALLTACTEPKEGCLDINAVNYQVDADRPCADCCEYPTLQFDILHKVRPDSEANLTYEDSIYQDGAGNDFRISDIQFYLSDVALLRPDGSAVRVTDTLQLTVERPGGGAGIQVVTDDFALLNPNDFRSSIIGTFISQGAFSEVRFDVGIEEAANYVDPVLLPEEHPLALVEMYWNADSGRIYNRLDLFRIEEQTDTLRTLLEIGLPENLQTVKLPLPTPFELSPGFGPSLVIRIDYLTWFEDVDLKNDDRAVLIQKIVNNLTESFSIIAIEQKLQ